MMKYGHLLGRKFEHGVTDCYTLLQDFYKDNFDIILSDYARPDDWWVSGQDLYMDNFKREGFYVVEGKEMREGDVFLVAVPDARAMGEPVPTNHCAIYVGEGKVVHHLLGRESKLVPYKGMLRNFTTNIIRHSKAGEVARPDTTEVDLMDRMLPHKRRMLEDALKNSE